MAGSGADAVPARPPRKPAVCRAAGRTPAAMGTLSRLVLLAHRGPRRSSATPSARGLFLVEALDRPMPRSVPEAQGHPRERGIDLEDRSWPDDHWICRRLVANRGEAHDGQLAIAPADLARPPVEPVRSDLDLDRLDSDHCHLVELLTGGVLPSAGALGPQNGCS